MSQLADIQNICKGMHESGFSKTRCANLYLAITGALEWDLYDDEVDFYSADWEEKQLELAMKTLFGETNE